ncbi:hypothetical protein [Streptomyces sp. NPDC005879]|uniref:hypothetical protein n=1 Tax=Streptomyces sp. NPDC005879 TaxID=3154567 RepID=UPI0033F8442C
MKKTLIFPLATLTLLVAACSSGGGENDGDDTAGAAKKAGVTASATASPTPTPEETPSARPFTLPALKGKPQGHAVSLLRDHHLRLGLITNRPAHKEISLPSGGTFDGWIICSTDPAQGSRITNSTELSLYLARTTSACVRPTPKPLPKKTQKTQATPAPAPAAKKPDPVSPRTCPGDGSQPGYACTSTGKVVVEGEFCAGADHGRTLKASNGRMATCEDYNGWRWNA